MAILCVGTWGSGTGAVAPCLSFWKILILGQETTVFYGRINDDPGDWLRRKIGNMNIFFLRKLQ
jgi:hypothetical protein